MKWIPEAELQTQFDQLELESAESVQTLVPAGGA
jgi:hypothetical protein